jgi:hypothetical protein
MTPGTSSSSRCQWSSPLRLPPGRHCRPRLPLPGTSCRPECLISARSAEAPRAGPHSGQSRLLRYAGWRHGLCPPTRPHGRTAERRDLPPAIRRARQRPRSPRQLLPPLSGSAAGACGSGRPGSVSAEARLMEGRPGSLAARLREARMPRQEAPCATRRAGPPGLPAPAGSRRTPRCAGLRRRGRRAQSPRARRRPAGGGLRGKPRRCSRPGPGSSYGVTHNCQHVRSGPCGSPGASHPHCQHTRSLGAAPAAFGA